MKQQIKAKIADFNVVMESVERDKIVYVLGADSYFGMHMCKHFYEHGYQVVGCGKKNAVPEISFCEYQRTDYRHIVIPQKKYSWILFCHDPHTGYEEHITALRLLCDNLKTISGRWRTVYFSSVSVCFNENGLVKENDLLRPHNQLEMSIISAENWLHVNAYESEGQIIPYIYRLCDLYGSEFFELDSPGLLNKIVSDAIKKKRLSLPGLGTWRNRYHICDACESLIAVMESVIPPNCLNIPGERYNTADIIFWLSNRLNLEVEMNKGENYGDDYSHYAGNRNVSKVFFSNIVKFSPQYTFKTWFRSLQKTKLSSVS